MGNRVELRGQRLAGPCSGILVRPENLRPGWLGRWGRHKALMAKRLGPAACWPPIGCRSAPSGVGRPKVGLLDGRTTQATRAIFAAETGEMPAGLVAMHSCDNPWCCNPAHLSAATASANSFDMTNKGRCILGKVRHLAIEASREAHRRGALTYRHLRRGRNPKSIAVVDPSGVVHVSILAAAEAHRLSGSCIRYRCRKSLYGWAWA